jgi:hypothetical protein
LLKSDRGEFADKAGEVIEMVGWRRMGNATSNAS